jgi:hypothetical protein
VLATFVPREAEYKAGAHLLGIRTEEHDIGCTLEVCGEEEVEDEAASWEHGAKLHSLVGAMGHV